MYIYMKYYYGFNRNCVTPESSRWISIGTLKGYNDLQDSICNSFEGKVSIFYHFKIFMCLI